MPYTDRPARPSFGGRPRPPGDRPSGPRPGGQRGGAGVRPSAGFRPCAGPRPGGSPRPGGGPPPSPGLQPGSGFRGIPRPPDVVEEGRSFDERPPRFPADVPRPAPRPRFPADQAHRPDRFGPRTTGQRDFRPRDFRTRDARPRQFAPPPVVRAAPAPELEPGEELIAGRRPVEEAFTAGRPPRRLLVTPQRRQALERIVLHATTLRIPIVEVEGGSLTALAGFDGHQGVAVVVEARRFASLDDILARSIERNEAAFVLVLDSLEDPQNVGTLLRSAEAAGVHGVIFPTERQAPLSPAAIKASAGATEHLLLAPVDDLAGALTTLHLRGLRVVGSEADAALSAREADLRGPTAIVVGSEGHGLSPAIRRRCDLFVRIPMRGVVGSLNAAVAGSILLFEALGQRDPAARPAGAAPAAAPRTAATPSASAGPKRASKRATTASPEPTLEVPSDPVADRDTAAASDATEDAPLP
ncbi:MAG TPA: 23S rRNA (guanosine(2251)-2'-O)-methyltransferase RlmB [Candidatus Dormibacteraeota bacterium]|nr:23S rRNA (guanosine(2251)-2'-O)-methyltransferase RlmB [Candidatus Dormibacteraeota bacterium]